MKLANKKIEKESKFLLLVKFQCDATQGHFCELFFIGGSVVEWLGRWT